MFDCRDLLCALEQLQARQSRSGSTTSPIARHPASGRKARCGPCDVLKPCEALSINTPDELARGRSGDASKMRADQPQTPHSATAR